jgi:hypothetical protein
MVVSENSGDIIYTKDFKAFKDEMGFNVYVCRKADPETKGKVENQVKYVKYSYLSIRNFMSIEEIIAGLRKWMDRRANGKICQATKKIPALMIDEERKYLQPLKNSIFRKDSLLGREERTVNDKSQISVGSSHYSLPVTYRNQTVEIYRTKTELFVFDQITGKEIASHNISAIPGQLVQDRNHKREKEKTANELKDNTLNMFGISEWKDFVVINFKKFARYVRDQSIEAKKYFSKDIDIDILKKSLKYCIENETPSFSNLNDTYKYFRTCDIQLKSMESNRLEEKLSIKELNSKIPAIDVKTRDIKKYKDYVN